MDGPEDKSRLLRLVDYLSALLRVNARIVSDLEEYQKVLWISDIPSEPKYCFSRASGEQEDTGGDTWIEIKKFPEPPCPKVPDSCRDWVDRETLKNPNDLSELNSTITEETEERDPETGEVFHIQQTRAINDYPEVQKDWETYVDKQWFPRTELHARYAAVHAIYSALFLIHQELLKLGEQYELVRCFGLLSWRTPTGHQVRRHLVTAKASLEFEPHLGKFTIKPTMDGD